MNKEYFSCNCEVNVILSVIPIWSQTHRYDKTPVLHHSGSNQTQSVLQVLGTVHMGSFPHPVQYFAAAGENDDFVIAVINFQLNQYFWKFLCYLFGYVNTQISNMKTNWNF